MATNRRHRPYVRTPIVVAATAVCVSLALGAPPGEVAGVAVDRPSNVSWSAVAGAATYDVYRGSLSQLRSGVPPRCHANDVAATVFASPENPAPGEAFVFLVTAESSGAEEGTPGNQSDGSRRALLGRCDPVMRNNLLSRLGYGWDEWSKGRLQTLGVQGYINEQLNPGSIDESTNSALNSRMAALDPPEYYWETVGQRIVKGTYGRRQLEEVMATFWENHFNTGHINILVYFLGQFPTCVGNPVPWCDPNYPYIAYGKAAKSQRDETEKFRDFAFNGNFRDILEASFKSIAMIEFLDTTRNVKGTPNENYAREVLELHSLGIDGGYTQHDIAELAKVFTGWNECKKKTAVMNDPLGACEAFWWREDIPGGWVANFDPNQHECGQKILFQGTPQERIIPATCGNLPAGVDDVTMALDAIAAHPSVAPFIVKKLLKLLVQESPPQSMVNAIVAEWNDASNPNGKGDLREVLRAITQLPEFRSPDLRGMKYRTPLEQVIAGFRAARGTTDGVTKIFDYLNRMSHLPYLNEVPTGYSELGSDWIDTNNLLERQKFGLEMTRSVDATFGSDVTGLLQANGVSTAPGNATAIVDFFSDVLFGGALTPNERQRAIDYLNTDDNGVSSTYDDARIRETHGFMMGFAQFGEQ